MTADPDIDLRVLADSTVRAVFGAGRLDEIGERTRQERANRVLLVTDRGIVAAGHVDRAVESLRGAGLNVTVFDGVEENPTTAHVEAGLQVARENDIDFLIGLGGGSSMDCAKGINFLYTNGGRMRDYWGVDKAAKDMLGMIAVPTTAGTGSDAQSFALITDPQSHQKMACGDQKAMCRLAILDSDLTATQPRAVAANAGIDAVAHAVETSASKRRNETSRSLSKRAWQLLESAYERAIEDSRDVSAREKMLLGAHLAGAAIERSMLGAAHACANPLTARYGITHGTAVSLLLPHVVRFNSAAGDAPYADLCADGNQLADRLATLAAAADLPSRLSDVEVSPRELPELAAQAAEQWTARFNPVSVGQTELLEIYQSAL